MSEPPLSPPVLGAATPAANDFQPVVGDASGAPELGSAQATPTQPSNARTLSQDDLAKLPLQALLVRAAYLTVDQLSQALSESVTSGRPVEEIAVERGWVARTDVDALMQAKYAATSQTTEANTPPPVAAPVSEQRAVPIEPVSAPEIPAAVPAEPAPLPPAAEAAEPQVEPAAPVVPFQPAVAEAPVSPPAPAPSPVVEAAPEPPTVEAAPEPPVIEAAPEPPTVEAAPEPPVIEAAAEPPTVEAAPEPPVMEAAPESSVVEAAAEPPALHAVPTTEPSAEAPELHAAPSAPDATLPAPAEPSVPAEPFASAPAAPVAPEAAPAAPEAPVAAQPAPGEETIGVFLHLTSGERMWVGRFATQEEAEEHAQLLVTQLMRPELGVWPRFGGRLVRPEAVVSIELSPRD